MANVSDALWRERGGIEVERQTLAGFGAVLLTGPRISPGLEREAWTKLGQGGQVLDVTFHGLVLPPARPLETRPWIPLELAATST